MRGLSLRTLVWLVTVAGGFVALATGAYGAFRVIPVVRQVRSATAPLVDLSRRLREYDVWIQRGQGLAAQVAAAPSQVGLDSLGAWMAHYDDLAGALRFAEVPDSVRVLLAAADNVAARFAVTVQEMQSLLELGRIEEARERLEAERMLAQRVRELAAESQARSLDRLVTAQRGVEALSRRLLRAFVVWALGTVGVLALTVRLVRRRVAQPLKELQAGLAHTAAGDLGVQLDAHADDEIGALTRQFNQMTAVLRSRAEAQGQMAAASVLLANAAHEVNNPLMSIGATAEGRLADSALRAEARRDLEEILRQVRRASRLVRAIVRFVRPSPGAEARADVNEVCRESVDLLASQFAADGIATALALAPDLPPARLEPHKLEQILVALLSNAHEALSGVRTEQRTVSVRSVLDGDRVATEVRDTGPGVAEEARGRLFAPFATTRPGGHVGLGLYTARRAAREAGGDLVHETTPHPGALFRLTLPLASAEPQDAPATAAAAVESVAGLRILLVDDEPAVRAPLARFLQRRGATVREAGDGREALAVLAAGPSDIVVADLRMPGMDGLALYRALRSRDPDLAARMVFLSGDVAQFGDLEGEIAADRVMPKPLELEEFERFLLAHR